MKALQTMQLALQYLNYSQQIIVKKIQTTKLYLEKQKEQVELCHSLDKKQRAKIKNYKKAIEGLSKQAEQYELMAKRVCPDLFEKNIETLKVMQSVDNSVQEVKDIAKPKKLVQEKKKEIKVGKKNEVKEREDYDSDFEDDEDKNNTQFT